MPSHPPTNNEQLTEPSVNSAIPKPGKPRWSPPRLRLVIGAVGLFALVLSGAWLQQSHGQTSETPLDTQAAPTIPVRTVRVGNTSGDGPAGRVDGASWPENPSLEASGTLRPSRVATLSFAVSGVVAVVSADEGDEVRRDQTLARLDAVPFRATLAQLEARASFLDARLQRSEQLAESGAISPEELDQDRAELSSMRAQVEAARWNLRRTELRAPFAGSVRTRTVETGQVVSPSVLAYEVIATDTLEAHISLPARDLSRISRHTPVTVTSADRPGFETTGTLSHWPVSGDPRSGSVPLVVDVPDPHGLLLSGMVVTCRFPALTTQESNDGVVLPLSSVRMEPTGAVVFRVENGTAQRCAVQVGSVRANEVSVQGGIQTGDIIIIEPPDRLRDGDRVTADNLVSHEITEG